MRLRRFIAILGSLGLIAALSLVSSDARASGSADSSPAPFTFSGGVKKDDSQMTVAGSELDRNIPIVDVATTNKLKKKPPSFWSKLAHPTQWFGSSKAKK